MIDLYPSQLDLFHSFHRDWDQLHEFLIRCLGILDDSTIQHLIFSEVCPMEIETVMILEVYTE